MEGAQAGGQGPEGGGMVSNTSGMMCSECMDLLLWPDLCSYSQQSPKQEEVDFQLCENIRQLANIS